MRGHWRRLLVQIAILASMLLLNAISADLYVGLVSISIVALPVASWTVFAMLLWTSQQAPDIQSLSERVDDALTLSLISSVAAGIGTLVLGKLLGFITTPTVSIVTVGLGFIVVEVSIPAIGFLRTWRDIYLPMVRGKRADRIEREAVIADEQEAG
jgi:hypothetical protein